MRLFTDVIKISDRYRRESTPKIRANERMIRLLLMEGGFKHGENLTHQKKSHVGDVKNYLRKR